MSIKLGFTKAQVLNTLKVALFIGISALLDYLISATSGTQFGVFTGIINLGLVALRNFIKSEQA